MKKRFMWALMSTRTRLQWRSLRTGAVVRSGSMAPLSTQRMPCQLMARLGLVPSEQSSGNSTKRGRLTKTGNALARTMLVEAGWSYRHPPKEGHPDLKRSAHLPQYIKDIGWKAQNRLCKRYRALSRTSKPQPRVLAAIARELAGFVWDIARQTTLKA